MSKERILIIDAYNTFARNYIVDPSIAADGSPIGGCKGFLKSLQKLARETKPSQIIIVWDGEGGSRKRRKLVENYKDGRKPFKLNRNIDNLTEEEISENRIEQFLKLVDYLNEMPVLQYVIDGIEADDVIGLLCSCKRLSGKHKIIVSSDKDFYQLCNSETIIIRPAQKEIMNEKRILEQHGIHPNNFAIARAVEGDKSDNLVGVKGVGLKTLVKRMPFLAEEKTYTLDDIFEFCKKQIEEGSKLKLFESILEEREIVELNYKVMQLYAPNISLALTQKIFYQLENFEPSFNKTEVLKKMIFDGIGDYNWESLFQTFRLLTTPQGGMGH